VDRPLLYGLVTHVLCALASEVISRPSLLADIGTEVIP
jgi:hypothetical protein